MTEYVKKYKIGIIGCGVLGDAMIHGFSLHADIKVYDKYKPSDKLEDVINHSDIIFLCLPTPIIKETGKYDVGILEENIKKINETSNNKIVVIRSTITPGTTKEFSEKYTNIRFVFNPEFLTARVSRLDFINASRIILGGEKENVKVVEELYRYRFGNSINIFNTSFEAAELTKIAANCFFSTKVLYFNTIYKVCQNLGIKYDDVKDMILADGRIGRSHCEAPGHDGKFGIGGLCLPKDLNAMISYMKDIGVESGLLEAVWDINVKYRPDRDWEKIPGVISDSNKDPK